MDDPEKTGDQYKGNLPAMGKIYLIVNTKTIPTSHQGTSLPTSIILLGSTPESPFPPASPVVKYFNCSRDPCF